MYSPTILLMEEILHQLIGSLSHYLQRFIHPSWCWISSVNSIMYKRSDTCLNERQVCVPQDASQCYLEAKPLLMIVRNDDPRSFQTSPPKKKKTRAMPVEPTKTLGKYGSKLGCKKSCCEFARGFTFEYQFGPLQHQHFFFQPFKSKVPRKDPSEMSE